MTGMERSVSCLEGPIPERRRRRQVSTAPAQRIVSILGEIVSLVPELRVRFTPVTALFETLTLETQALVRIVRFGRFS